MALTLVVPKSMRSIIKRGCRIARCTRKNPVSCSPGEFYRPFEGSFCIHLRDRRSRQVSHAMKTYGILDLRARWKWCSASRPGCCTPGERALTLDRPLPSELSEAVISLPCIREVPDSNLGRDTDKPYRFFSCFS
jgi:hypothetical protein